MYTKLWFVSIICVIFSFGLLCLQCNAQGKNRKNLTYPRNTKLNIIKCTETPRPEYLKPTIDPDFKTNIIRITDHQKMNVKNIHKILCHGYPKNQPWNCNGTLIKIANIYILNARTYKIAGTYSQPSSECLWSYKDPHKMFAFSPRKFLFMAIKLTKDKKTKKFSGKEIQLKKFSGYQNMFMGRWEATLSWDDKYATFMGQKGNNLHIIILHVPSRKIIAETIFTGKWPAGKEPRIDYCTMSPSGKYLIANWRDKGSGRCQGVEVYDQKLKFLRHLTDRSEHAQDGYDTRGNEVHVQFTCTARKRYDAEVISIRLRDGKVTKIIDRSLCTLSGHISCCNYRRPGWAYITAYSPLNEIFAVKLDGSQKIEHFAHTRINRAGCKHEAHGVPNPDGTKFMFASNWSSKSKNDPPYSYVAWKAKKRKK